MDIQYKTEGKVLLTPVIKTEDVGPVALIWMKAGKTAKLTGLGGTVYLDERQLRVLADAIPQIIDDLAAKENA